VSLLRTTIDELDECLTLVLNDVLVRVSRFRILGHFAIFFFHNATDAPSAFADFLPLICSYLSRDWAHLAHVKFRNKAHSFI